MSNKVQHCPTLMAYAAALIDMNRENNMNYYPIDPNGGTEEAQFNDDHIPLETLFLIEKIQKIERGIFRHNDFKVLNDSDERLYYTAAEEGMFINLYRNYILSNRDIVNIHDIDKQAIFYAANKGQRGACKQILDYMSITEQERRDIELEVESILEQRG